MIADSGTSTTCVQPVEEQGKKSECGKYKWDPPFVRTEEESNRIFQTARGDMAPGENIVHIPGLPLRIEVSTGHTSRGPMNNIGSMRIMTRNSYISIFQANIR